MITTPSGTQPSSAGTGYIGNAAALNRAWSGDLSDLRIYNRILSQAEVSILTGTSSVNYAPSASAGTDQTVIWPSAAALSGTVNDNGDSPASVTTTWSETGGAAGVAFGNPNSVSTTATFPTPGAYQLQLAAGNGQATTVSWLTVDAITPILSHASLPGTLLLSWPANSSNWLLQYRKQSAFWRTGNKLAVLARADNESSLDTDLSKRRVDVLSFDIHKLMNEGLSLAGTPRCGVRAAFSGAMSVVGDDKSRYILRGIRAVTPQRGVPTNEWGETTGFH